VKNFYTLSDLEAWTEAPEQIRLGVLGFPVAHSLSPAMQNGALAAAELNLRYARFEIQPNKLERALRRCAALGFLGVNLTAPHKLAGFLLVDECDQTAREIGAINTIRFIGGGSAAATNTDGPGFERGIRESFNAELRDLHVIVLGASGGGGRAVTAQCARAGCSSVALVSRDFKKAQRLAQRWNRQEIFALPWPEDSLSEGRLKADLIVNATPLGLQPNDPSPLPAHLLDSHHLVYDLNYKPTAFLAEAAAAGARAASGLTMLLHQGACAFDFWLDRPAPLAAMRRALGL
jgi:shikimate dehydrogenase